MVSIDIKIMTIGLIIRMTLLFFILDLLLICFPLSHQHRRCLEIIKSQITSSTHTLMCRYMIWRIWRRESKENKKKVIITSRKSVCVKTHFSSAAIFMMKSNMLDYMLLQISIYLREIIRSCHYIWPKNESINYPFEDFLLA